MKTIYKILGFKEIFIFLFFVILSSFFYIAITRADHVIFGGAGGDDFLNIYGIWWNKYRDAFSFGQNFNPLINYPYDTIFNAFDSSTFWGFIVSHLNRILNEISTYNILNWLSFPLSAIGMYFLAFYVTRSRLASFISGFIFAFTPYHVIRAAGHMTLAHIEWIPLCVLFLLMMVGRKSDCNEGILRLRSPAATFAQNDRKERYLYAVLAAVFFALNFYTDYYYGLFLSIFVVVFFSVWMFMGSRFAPLARTVIKPTLIFGLFSMLLIGSYLGWIFFSGGQETQKMATSFSRPIGDLYHWGGSLKYYFIPWQENYLLGNFWNKIFYNGNGIPDGEWLAYLGWPGILLAGYGVWRWGRERRNLKSSSDSSFTKGGGHIFFDFVMILFVVTAIAATIFSFTPPLSPSKWIYKILPQFRVYARFFVFVSLSVSVLAGVGLKYLFERLTPPNFPLYKGRNEEVIKVFRSIPLKRLKFYIFAIILIAVLVDFVPSFKTTDISKVPPEYEWLKNQPKMMFSTRSNSNVPIVIAEYPYVNSNYAPTPTYLFWQRIHQKPMINGQPEPDPTGKEKIRQVIYDVTNPRTPRILKKLGATYLILHKDQYNQPYWPNTLVPPEKKLPKKVKMNEINPGLKLVQRFGLTYVYEIK